MRKFNYGLKATLFAIAALATIGMFTACGDDEGSPSVNEDELTGKDWKIMEALVIADGKEVAYPNFALCDMDDAHQFKANGDYFAIDGNDFCNEDRDPDEDTLSGGLDPFNIEWEFDAENNRLEIERGLLASYFSDPGSEGSINVIQVEELTETDLVLYHEYVADDDVIRVELRLTAEQ